MTEHDEQMKRVVLDWTEVGVHQKVSREILPGLPVGVVDAQVYTGQFGMDFMMNTMTAKLKAFLLKKDLPGHQVHKRVTVSWQVPASWWQHLKHQHETAWWLAWLVQWKPVQWQTRYREVNLRAEWRDMATYPWQTVVPTARGLGKPVRQVELLVEVAG